MYNTCAQTGSGWADITHSRLRPCMESPECSASSFPLTLKVAWTTWWRWVGTCQGNRLPRSITWHLGTDDYAGQVEGLGVPPRGRNPTGTWWQQLVLPRRRWGCLMRSSWNAATTSSMTKKGTMMRWRRGTHVSPESGSESLWWPRHRPRVARKLVGQL